MSRRAASTPALVSNSTGFCATSPTTAPRSSCCRPTPSSFRACAIACLCSRAAVVVGELVGDAITEQAITGAAITADTELVRASSSDARRARIRRFLSGDYAPAVILTALIVALGLYTYSMNPFFLSSRSLQAAPSI